MIFIDTWVFVEFFSEGEKFKRVEKIINKIKSGKKTVTSTMVLTELKYIIAKRYGIRKSDEVIHQILTLPNIKILPVSMDVALLAASLRIKYYHKEKRPLSYGDVINLATALIANCKVFYSGDPDFKGIEEIKTIII
jgi:predicted nucleic acid-binding protein